MTRFDVKVLMNSADEIEAKTNINAKEMFISIHKSKNYSNMIKNIKVVSSFCCGLKF